MNDQPIKYMIDASPYEVMDSAWENVYALKGAAHSVLDTTRGLQSGQLQNDVRSAMIVAELVAGLREKTEAAIDSIVVELLHMDNPPPTNAIARAVGLSVKKVKAIDARAEPYPEDEE